MDVVFGIVRLLIAVVLAIAAGKLISKLRLPAILGWLIAGMIMGPHAIGLLDDQLLDSTWFSTLESLNIMEIFIKRMFLLHVIKLIV